MGIEDRIRARGNRGRASHCLLQARRRLRRHAVRRRRPVLQSHDRWCTSSMPKRRSGKGKEFDSSSAAAANSKRRAYASLSGLSGHDDGLPSDDDEMDLHVPESASTSAASSSIDAGTASDADFTLQLVSGENVYAAVADDFGLIGATIAVPNSTWPGYSGGASRCYVHGFAREISAGPSYIVSCVKYPGSYYALTLQTMADLSRKKCVQPSQTARRKLQGQLDSSVGTAAASAYGVVP